MNIKHQLAALAWLLPCVAMWADDGADEMWVYRYGAGEPTILSNDDVRSIRFSYNGISITTSSGIESIAYEEFDKITFNIVGNPFSSVSVPGAEDGITTSYDPGSQTVTAMGGEKFLSISVCNAQGLPTGRTAVGQGTCSISLAGLPQGIYIVRATDGQQQKVSKFVKP